jgi:methanesulfonate monooxygenase small subunit
VSAAFAQDNKIQPMPPDRIAIEEVVYRSCLALDGGDYKGYLALCDDGFRYTVTAHSPEIRKDMTWLDHDKAEMQLLFNNLPRHNSDHSPLARHAHVYTVETASDRKSASVVSTLQVYKTTLDGGATELFAIGRYLDTVSLEGAAPTLSKRIVRLETRQFGFGYHVPF